MIENTLKSVFGIECKIEKTKVKGLPLYMTARREFYRVNMEDFSFLLVKIPSDDRFGAVALEKQVGKIRVSAECEIAFYFEKLTKKQREALIDRRIPFVAGADQIYLPFLGIVLRNNLKAESGVSADKMMPSTQSLFLYLFYGKREYVLKKQAADDLGLSRMSITRASEQLKAMGLIHEEACGKETRMSTVGEGFELYQAAKPFLITPVQRTVYAEKKDVSDKLLTAGESALSKVSMLGEPKYEAYAVFKGAELVKKLKTVDIAWQKNDSAIQIELWKYNPALFAVDGMVDPISLAQSLAENADERVRGELKRFLEEYEW